MALRIVEILVAVMLLLVLIMQVIIPLARGRPVFPILRRQGKLEVELNSLRQQQDEQALQNAIQKLKPKVTRSRKKGN